MVCAAFDRPTDAAILAVRELVRAAGVALPLEPSHRPHFSLGAARVERDTELDRVMAVAGGVAAAHGAIDVVLDEVGRFGRGGVIWLGPAASRQLAELQRDVTTALTDAGWPPAFAERSDPEQWVPHCTLATRLPLPRLREVHALVRAQYRPIRGCVGAIATILVGGRGDIGHPSLLRPPS